MGVVKVVASKTGANRQGLKASLNYIFRQDKSEKEYRAVTGPFEGDVEPKAVFDAFVKEQEQWDKTAGRTYAHYVLSWHKDEHITKQQALDIGIAFADDFFAGHQTAIALHINKNNNVHCHLVVNSVSFIDGAKLHLTKGDLCYAKGLNDTLCQEQGLKITRAGYDFYGNKLKNGTVSSYSNRQYQMIQHKKDESYISDCYQAVKEAIRQSHTRAEFIQKMEEKKWKVDWSDTRKHVVFEDEEGHKIRASRLGKIYHEDFSKENLEREIGQDVWERTKTVCDPNYVWTTNQFSGVEQELEAVCFEENQSDAVADAAGMASALGQMTARLVKKEVKKQSRGMRL